MESLQKAVHRTIVVVDIEGFGDRRRTAVHQVAARAGLYRALRQALGAAGIAWAQCDREDRGDGALILVPAEVPKSPLIDAVPHALVVALCEHNATHSAEEHIRLRMAVHAGEVTYDEHGVTAEAVNLAFRLLDAQPLKIALAESPGTLAVITSVWFFDEVVRHSQITDHATFRPVRVSVKETSVIGWIGLPDHPYPSDAAHLKAPTPGEPVLHQVHTAPGSFTGRADERAILTLTLDKETGRDATVVISAVPGTRVTTWLALQRAHQYVDRFPDGQLFVASSTAFIVTLIKKFRDYATIGTVERPGLRIRTVELYRWLLRKLRQPRSRASR